MSTLQKDFEKAFKKTAMVPETEKNENIEVLSEELAEAVKDFLLKQEFRVVKMTSDMDVEQIRTTADIKADVAPETLMGPYSPAISFAKKMIGTLVDLASLVPGAGVIMSPIEEAVNKLEGLMKSASRQVAGEGASVPRLKLNKKGSKNGGALRVKGTSNIEMSNYKKATKPTGIAEESVVKLFPDEVKDDK